MVQSDFLWVGENFVVRGLVGGRVLGFTVGGLHKVAACWLRHC